MDLKVAIPVDTPSWRCKRSGEASPPASIDVYVTPGDWLDAQTLQRPTSRFYRIFEIYFSTCTRFARFCTASVLRSFSSFLLTRFSFSHFFVVWVVQGFFPHCSPFGFQHLYRSNLINSAKSVNMFVNFSRVFQNRSFSDRFWQYLWELHDMLGITIFQNVMFAFLEKTLLHICMYL